MMMPRHGSERQERQGQKNFLFLQRLLKGFGAFKLGKLGGLGKYTWARVKKESFKTLSPLSLESLYRRRRLPEAMRAVSDG